MTSRRRRQGDRDWNPKTFGTFVLPGNDGKPAPVFAGGSNIGISATSKNQDLSRELLRIIFSADYQKKLGGAGLGPANSDYVSSLGTDEFAKALIASASNSKLTPAAPGWAAVESAQVMEEFFGKIRDAADLVGARAEYDAKITPCSTRSDHVHGGREQARPGRRGASRDAAAAERRGWGAWPSADVVAPGSLSSCSSPRSSSCSLASATRWPGSSSQLPQVRPAPAVRTAARVGGARELQEPADRPVRCGPWSSGPWSSASSSRSSPSPSVVCSPC